MAACLALAVPAARHSLPAGRTGPARRVRMTSVDGIGPIVPAARSPARPSARGIGFAVPGGQAEAALCPAAATEACEVSLGGMLALQEAESGAVRDREARRRGQEMLAELLRLQRALLAGHRDLPALRRLAALAADIPDAADPGLRQALAEVTLRARVELARHESVTTA
jgi:hypothetical protein